MPPSSSNKGHTAEPRTPPPPRTRAVATLAPSISSGPRTRSTVARAAPPPPIMEEDDESERFASDEESPIKNNLASPWWARQARTSLGKDPSSTSPARYRCGDQQGIFSTPAVEHTPSKVLGARKARFDDSPTSIKSSSSSVSSTYVPPHLRTRRPEENFVKPHPFLPSLGKNSLTAFDRSSAPDSEDSFYTFSNEPSFAFSHFSAHPSTPNSSRDLSRGFGLSPTFTRASKTSNASPSPRSLSRPSRINTSPFIGHPRAILEEDEASPTTGVTDTDHLELLQGEVPLGPVLPLASIRDEGTGVNLSHLEIVDDRTLLQDCSGCGLIWDRSFVVFLPCRHSCCPDCLNSMVNGAAHKPPRPTDCFSCSRLVDGFEPWCQEHYASRGGPGIAQVLAATLQEEDHKLRTAARRSPSATISRPSTEEEDEKRRMSRTGRRRSSVVAAAISATLLSRPKSVPSTSRQASPTHLRATFSPSSLNSRQELNHDTLASIPCDGAGEGLATSTPEPNTLEAVSSSSQWSEQTQGALTPLLDWSSEPMPVSERYFPGSLSTRSSRSSYDSSLDDISLRSSLDALPPRRTEWPVVRLDNLPWSVTADEVEHWLPDGSLASDVGFSPELVSERVTLAVHILCNRVDGRTLNQAFVECRSLEAAKAIVRLRDGTRLRGRPLHIAMSTQSELLSTIFPTYSPGFEGLDAHTNAQAPCALVLESELGGLLELCRLESPHALKAPERPYFNLVSIIEKLPFHQVEAYAADQIASLFDAAVVAVETLQAVKDHVAEWREILTVLIDAILRCPGFLPAQKKKVVKLAGGLGFVQTVPSKAIDVFYDHPSPSRASSLAAAITFPAVPSGKSSGRQSVTSSFEDQVSPSVRCDPLATRTNLAPETCPSPSPGARSGSAPASASASASDAAFLSVLRAAQQPRPALDPGAGSCSRVPSPSYVFPPPLSPRVVAEFPVASTPEDALPSRSRPRRHSSIARRLNIDVGLVTAVANELGIILA
ncbi:hypothetical protein JCM11491_001957 [Sporobolomyces phaffii]